MAGLRQACVADAEAISRIEVETWRTTYPGMLADHVLVGMSTARHNAMWESELRRQPDGIWVWEGPGGEVLGFGHCGLQRDAALGYEGEVYMLYVLPDAQGRGIGRALLLALFGSLLEQGLRSALVWVVRANPSRFFYERLGGKLVLQRRIPVGGQPVEAVGYGWKDLSAILHPSRGRGASRRRGR